MNKLKMKALFSLAGCLSALCAASVGAEETYRGLWVGQVTLSHVNEVTVPLDENNNPIAPDPNTPTPTADQAHLRLILHVNGAGQVNLLKDVAVLRRNDPGDPAGLVDSENDLALISDERLYSDFPAQEAIRIASAVFDFGDFQASAAVDAIVDEIVKNVAASVAGSGVDANSTDAELRAAEDAAQLDAETNALAVVGQADVATAYNDFMVSKLLPSALEDIAGAADPADEAGELRSDAAALTNSFYADTRAMDAIDAIVAAVISETNEVEKLSAAQFIASRYDDTANLYQRFITGKNFGDIIPEAAQAAAAAAVADGATEVSVSNAVYDLPAVTLLADDAKDAQVQRYSDTAALDAVNQVLDAIIESASAFTNSSALDISVATAAETAGREAQVLLPRFELPLLTPTADYTTFVQSAAFLDSVPGAAEAAAVAAVSEMGTDPFADLNSLSGVARIEAAYALRSVYSLAGQARRTELPMTGTFSPGQGDPRFTADAGAGSLGGPALECEVHLPASHPTNPFRHVKHPDHTVGIDITRNVRLDFDALPATGLERSASGTEQVTGIYREEIFGLHKLLGPASDTGLKVEGTFELNRVSLIDTLNAQ